MKKLAFFVSALAYAVAVIAQQNEASDSQTELPFRDASLSRSERVRDLVSRLTFDEKLEQIARGGGSLNGPAPAIPRLNIQPFQWGTECLHGDDKAGFATAFPQSMGLASSWNQSMVHLVAEAISSEVRAKHANYSAHNNYGYRTGLSCFAPVVNTFVHPMWGRGQETYGEDPRLISVMTLNYVGGLQSENNGQFTKVIATCKHFAGYDGPERNRLGFSAQISDRDWRTTFRPGFEACVLAGAHGFMCAYSAVNNTPSCASDLIQSQLRGEMHWDGFVISDEDALVAIWTDHNYTTNGVDTAAVAINSGVDVELSSTEHGIFSSYLKQAVLEGKVSNETIDTAVSRLFSARFQLGEFDAPEATAQFQRSLDVVESSEHLKLAKEAATQSFVLLKNSGNLLPLNASALHSVSVIGPMANERSRLILGDYAAVPSFLTTPLDGINQYAASYGFSVSTAASCEQLSCAVTGFDQEQIIATIKQSTVVVLVLGVSGRFAMENRDRMSIEFPGTQLQLLELVSAHRGARPVVLLSLSCGAINFDHRWYTMLSAIVVSCYPGQMGGEAFADLLFGNAAPSGRLAVSYWKSLSDVHSTRDYNISGHGVSYRFSEAEPFFPFGFGLSYTSFVWDNVHFSTANDDPLCSGIKLSLTVANNGSVVESDVVQVYAQWLEPAFPTPRVQLVAFEKVGPLQPGEVRQATLHIPSEQLGMFDNAGRKVLDTNSTVRLLVSNRVPGPAAAPNLPEAPLATYELRFDAQRSDSQFFPLSECAYHKRHGDSVASQIKGRASSEDTQ